MTPTERKELSDDISALIADLIELQQTECGYADRDLELTRFDITAGIVELRERIALFHERLNGIKGWEYAA